MGAIRLVCLALGCAAVGGPWAQAAWADEAAAMYEPSTVDAIELTLPKASEETLEEQPTKDYVEGFLTLRETSGTPGSEGPPVIDEMKVGIRLKGNEGGSFRPLDSGKAAFKIKCNFVKGKQCLGLKKMTLNNMVEDPSMIHETLAYAMFRAAGVPAPRTGYAYLQVNGEDFGLHLNIETLDDVALEKLFGSFDDEVQHLYEGEFGADVTPGAEYEVDEGEPENFGDLEALIAAVNASEPPSFSTRVAPVADLGEMTRMWAVEKYIGHWDGYSGREGEFQPSNYYLYSDPTGRFQMLPWGTDETWELDKQLPFDGRAGLLFNDCLADSTCATTYWESLRSLQGAVAGLDLDSLATQAAALLGPWEQIEQANFRHEYSLGQIQAAVSEVHSFIAARPGGASEWLAAHVPPSTPAQPPPPASPLGEPVQKPASELRIQRSKIAAGVLVTRLRLSTAGRVKQTATIKTGAGPIKACAARASVPAAGEVTLRCRLSKPIRRRLRTRWLRLEVRTRFDPRLGEPTIVTRRIRLPRAASS